MFISPVSSNSYKRLESYKKQVQEGTSEQPGQLGSTKDLPVGFDKGQFVKSDNGSGLLSNGSNIWEELSVAGVENFNFRQTGSSPTTSMSVTTSHQNIEVLQRTDSATVEATPTASAAELLAVDVILSNPDVQTMMAEQSFDIPKPNTPAEFALVERYGEQRYTQMQRYDSVMSTVRNDYQLAYQSAFRGNGGSSRGGRNDSVSYTTGTYWDVTHGRGKNGQTSSSFNMGRFNSDYRQRDTPSARLYATIGGSNIRIGEGGKNGAGGNASITFGSGEFTSLDLNDLPALRDQSAIFLVEGVGWATNSDNVVRDGGGIFGPVGGLISGIGDFVSDALNTAGNVLTDALDLINEEIVSPVISSIPVIGEPIDDYIVQPAFDFAELGVNLGINTIDFVIDTSTNLGAGVTEVFSNLAAGDISGALSSLNQTLATLGGDVVGFGVESFVLVYKTVAVTFNALFSSSEIRGLLPAEREYLETIFGDSLDYDDIEIQIGGAFESGIGFGNQAHAVGNTIYIPERYFQDGVLKEEGPDSGLDLLAHEAAHVWQFQNDGANYIEEAVASYIEDGLFGTDNAYDFTTAIRDMTPWDEMTPDQQAEIAMVIGEALEQNPDGILTRKDLSNAIYKHREVGPELDTISKAQLSYLLNIQQLLQNGQV